MTLYGEEEIVKLLNIHKKYSTGNVYTGITIKGDTYHFHEYSFWEHQVKLMLPLRFIDMPKQVWDAKYGHLEKMDVVKCSRDYSIDMMLSLTEEKLEESEIAQSINKQLQILKELQPGYEYYEQGMEDNGFIKVGWYDYRTDSPDVPLYCLIFMFSVNGKLAMGKFSCSIYRADTWKTVVLQMLYSMNNQDKTLKGEKTNE